MYDAADFLRAKVSPPPAAAKDEPGVVVLSGAEAEAVRAWREAGEVAQYNVAAAIRRARGDMMVIGQSVEGHDAALALLRALAGGGK